MEKVTTEMHCNLKAAQRRASRYEAHHAAA